MKLWLMAFILLAIPFFAFAADDPVCRIDDSGAMNCTGTLQSNEKRAACQLNDKMGYKPGCQNYPSIAWLVQQDRHFAVLVDPSPNLARAASVGDASSDLEGYALAHIKIRYQLGHEPAQNFACKQDANDAFMCNVSTQFVYLKCAEKPPADVNIVIQTDEDYKKDGAPDRIFQNAPASFDYAELKNQICAARAQAKAYTDGSQAGTR